MWDVFKLQWLRLKREPLLALSFLGMTVIFVFFIAGSQGQQTVNVQVFSNQLQEAEMDEWLTYLNEAGDIKFNVQDRETIEEQLQRGQLSFALELNTDNYRYLVAQDSPFLAAVDQLVKKVYQRELRIKEVAEQFPDQTIELTQYVDTESRSFAGGVSDRDRNITQIMTGMTLYFALYTILFGLMNIAIEKKTGTWDRLIFSPLKKSEIYLGHLLHYFSLGVFQISICFVIFNQVLDYNFGHAYLSIFISISAFVFAAVALGMLLIGLVRSPQQLQAIIPIISTAFAMLGGAFWPIELITNKFLLAVAQVTPIYHGIQALQQAIIYNAGVGDILQPISILLLMSVIFMGVGLNLMEGTK